MACLRNPQWEIFARETVELQLTNAPNARAKAYERAGYVVNSNPTITGANARKLSNRREVRERIDALFAEAMEYRDIRPAQIVTRIDRVGRANVADLYEADGVTLKNVHRLPREVSDAIESIEYVEGGTHDDGSPRYIAKIKMHDKNQANFTLLKHYGGLPEDRPEQRTVNIFGVLSVDDQRALAEALENFSAGPANPGGEVAGERREG